jgi:hypothetical protein
MAEEKKCKHCAMMIPDEAKVCPHCRKAQGTSTLMWIAVIFFGLIGIGMCSSLTTNNSGPAASNMSAKTESAAIVNTQPVLELQSWSWSKHYSSAIVEGAIKNISDAPIDNIVAHATFYDKNKEFISSDHALIDYRPLLPGQTSPFKIIGNFNPAMVHAIVDFKMFGGETLYWKNKEKKKP